MREGIGRAVEVTALVVIGVAVALGGRSTLAALHDRFLAAATIVLVLLIVVDLWTTLRLMREGRPEVRLDVSKRITYLAALVLALCAVLVPARWAVGACMAALELAVAFDIVTILARPRQVPS